jgi:hypothetical protein
MSSPARADVDALPYAQRLHAVLHGHLLPRIINLGQFNITAGKYVEQEDFKAMTAEEVQQLALRLQAQPHVTRLNLCRQRFGTEGARVLIAPISAQTGLQTLNLYGA